MNTSAVPLASVPVGSTSKLRSPVSLPPYIASSLKEWSRIDRIWNLINSNLAFTLKLEPVLEAFHQCIHVRYAAIVRLRTDCQTVPYFLPAMFVFIYLSIFFLFLLLLVGVYS